LSALPFGNINSMRITFALLLVLVGVASMFAAQDATAVAKKAIQQAYDEQSKAWMRLDSKALVDVFKKRTTDDYVSTADGKKIARKEILDGLAASMSRARKVYEYTIKIQSVKLNGNRADVATTGKIVVDVVDDNSATHRLEINQKVQSQWVKQAASWKARSSVITTTKMLVDGRDVRGGG
jgi:hypothetical protein